MALNFPKFAKVIYIHRNLSSNDPMTWISNFVLPLKTDYSKWSNLIYTWCPLFGNGHEMLWILQFFLPLNSMKRYWYGDTRVSSFIVNFINSSSEHCFLNCLFNSKLIHIRNIYIFFFQNWMILKLFLQRFFETSLKLEIMWCKIFIKLPTSICDILKVQKEKWQLLT